MAQCEGQGCPFETPGSAVVFHESCMTNVGGGMLCYRCVALGNSVFIDDEGTEEEYSEDLESEDEHSQESS